MAMTWSEIRYYDKFAYQIAFMDREESIGLIGPEGRDTDVAVILGFAPGISKKSQESALLPSYINGYPMCYLDEGEGYYTKGIDYIPFTENIYLEEVVFPITLKGCKQGLFTNCINLKTVVINHLFASYPEQTSGLDLFIGCTQLQFILNRSCYKITADDFEGYPPNKLTIYMLDNSSYGDEKNYGKVLYSRDSELTHTQDIKMLYFSDSDDGNISTDLTPLLAVVQGQKALIVGTIYNPLDASYSDNYSIYPEHSYAQTQVDSEWEEPDLVKIYNKNLIIGKSIYSCLYTSDYFHTSSTITKQEEQINEFEILPYAFCGFNSFTSVGLNVNKIGEKAFLYSFDSDSDPQYWSASVACAKCWISTDNENYTRSFESYMYEEDGTGQEPFAVADCLNKLSIALTYGCELTDWIDVTEATCTSTGLQARFCRDRFEYRGADLEQWQYRDHEYDTRQVEAHPNRMTIIQEATCTESGIKKEICIDCGEVFSTESISKLEHSMKFKAELNEKEPTCTEDGYNSGEVWECEKCGYVDYINASEIIPKLGHVFKESEEGKVYCSRCNTVLLGAHRYFWKKANWLQNKLSLVDTSDSFPGFKYDKILQNTFARDAFNLQRRTLKTYDYLIFKYSDYGYFVAPTATESAKNIVHLVIPTYSPEEEPIKGIYGFENHTKLQSVQLPEGLEFIDLETFSGCSNLTQVKLPQSLKELGTYSFQNCIKLNTIIYNGTVTEWQSILKGENWNLKVPAKEIHCADGIISITT